MRVCFLIFKSKSCRQQAYVCSVWVCVLSLHTFLKHAHPHMYRHRIHSKDQRMIGWCNDVWQEYAGIDLPGWGRRVFVSGCVCMYSVRYHYPLPPNSLMQQASNWHEMLALFMKKRGTKDKVEWRMDTTYLCVLEKWSGAPNAFQCFNWTEIWNNMGRKEMLHSFFSVYLNKLYTYIYNL